MDTRNYSNVLQKISSLISEGIIATDLNGNIFYINQEMLRYFANIGLENILGTTLSTILRHEKINTFIHHQISIRGVTISIKNVPFKLNAEKIDNVLLFSFQNMMLFETYKQETKALDIQVRAISNILDGIDSGILYIDQNECILYCNQKMGLFLGKESHSVINKSYRSFLKEHVGDDIEDTLLQSLYAETKLFSIQTSFYSNGEQFHFSKETTPIYIGNKKMGALCICKELSFQQLKTKNTLSSMTSLESSIEKYPLPFIKLRSKKFTKVYETFKNSLSKGRVVLYGEKGTGKTRFVYEYIKEIKSFEDDVLFITGEAQSDLLSISEVEKVIKDKVSWIILDNPQHFNLKYQVHLKQLFSSYRANNTSKYIMLLDDSPEKLFHRNKLNIDLFYFFANYVIELPPLRSNIEDLKHLITTATENYCNYIGIPKVNITSRQIEKLCTHWFSGNMNELGIFISEIASSNPTEEELDEKIEKLLASNYKLQTNSMLDSKDNCTSLTKFLSETNVSSLTEMIEMIEKNFIERTLKECNYHITNTAKILGITRQNLNYKLKKYNLRFEDS